MARFRSAPEFVNVQAPEAYSQAECDHAERGQNEADPQWPERIGVCKRDDRGGRADINERQRDYGGPDGGSSVHSGRSQ
jgi:hypothetical protein